MPETLLDKVQTVQKIDLLVVKQRKMKILIKSTQDQNKLQILRNKHVL